MTLDRNIQKCSIEFVCFSFHVGLGLIVIMLSSVNLHIKNNAFVFLLKIVKRAGFNAEVGHS